jgi:hypothetical protein
MGEVGSNLPELNLHDAGVDDGPHNGGTRSELKPSRDLTCMQLS